MLYIVSEQLLFVMKTCLLDFGEFAVTGKMVGNGKQGIVSCNSEVQDLVKDTDAILQEICRRYGFPPHNVLGGWGRRDTALIFYSRDLYGWEKTLQDCQHGKAVMARIWEHPEINELVFAQWQQYYQQHFNVSVKRVLFFARYQVNNQEYGYILNVFAQPVFTERYYSPISLSLVRELRFSQGATDANTVWENTQWTEEALNLELCRMVRETGGKGPERCRVMMLDKLHFLFLLSVFLGEGFYSAVKSDPVMARSLIHISKRHLWACVQNLLVKMGLRSIRCDIDLNLKKNEAAILVVL